MAAHRWRTLGLMGLAFGVVALCAGCFGLHHRVSSKSTGTRVSTARLAQVEEGATTLEDIVTAFGPPDQSYKLKENRKIVIYVERRREQTDTGFYVVFPLVHWKSEPEEEVIRYVFEFENDVLVDYRREKVGWE